jgi:IMP cyclohydrolase
MFVYCFTTTTVYHSMPPRKAAHRDAISQIMYACSGEQDQYEETVDAVMGAVETYLGQIASVALRLSETPDKIKPDAILQAIRNDGPKRAHVSASYEKYKEIQKARKSLTA